MDHGYSWRSHMVGSMKQMLSKEICKTPVSFKTNRSNQRISASTPPTHKFGLKFSSPDEDDNKSQLQLFASCYNMPEPVATGLQICKRGRTTSEQREAPLLEEKPLAI